MPEHDAADAPRLNHSARSGGDHTSVHGADVVTVARLLLNLTVGHLLKQAEKPVRICPGILTQGQDTPETGREAGQDRS